MALRMYFTNIALQSKIKSSIIYSNLQWIPKLDQIIDDNIKTQLKINTDNWPVLQDHYYNHSTRPTVIQFHNALWKLIHNTKLQTDQLRFKKLIILIWDGSLSLFSVVSERIKNIWFLEWTGHKEKCKQNTKTFRH